MNSLNKLEIRSFRGGDVETVHHVCIAVVDADGTLVAGAGDPGLITPTRSASKPFQAYALVADGAADALEVGGAELALASASHNSEVHQVETVRGWMQRLDLREDQLVCGPHRSLAKDLGFHRPDGTWEAVDLAPPSRIASNCSGKHVGMLALAKFHGWNQDGYECDDHPVQQRCRSVIADWFALPMSDVHGAVDGCGVISWAVPLKGLATGYAKLAGADEPMRAVVRAMTEHPDLVAGKRRLCTTLMRAFPGKVLAKVGAGGVYGAALLDRGLGIAIKVLDGDSKAASVALTAVLSELGLELNEAGEWARFVHPVIVNTNRRIVGRYEAVRS